MGKTIHTSQPPNKQLSKSEQPSDRAQATHLKAIRPRERLDRVKSTKEQLIKPQAQVQLPPEAWS